MTTATESSCRFKAAVLDFFSLRYANSKVIHGSCHFQKCQQQNDSSSLVKFSNNSNTIRELVLSRSPRCDRGKRGTQFLGIWLQSPTPITCIGLVRFVENRQRIGRQMLRFDENGRQMIPKFQFLFSPLGLGRCLTSGQKGSSRLSEKTTPQGRQILFPIHFYFYQHNNTNKFTNNYHTSIIPESSGRRRRSAVPGVYLVMAKFLSWR